MDLLYAYAIPAVTVGFYGFTYTSHALQTAGVSSSQQTADLLLFTHGASLVLFTLGLYVFYGLINVPEPTQTRFFRLAVPGKLKAAALLLVYAHFRANRQQTALAPLLTLCAVFEIYFCVLLAFRANVAPTFVPQRNWRLKTAQLLHSIPTGVFCFALAVAPGWCAERLLGHAIDDNARVAAVALGALDSTMTVMYYQSGVNAAREAVEFARCSIVSRLVAAIALLAAFVFGHGHLKALSGVPAGVLSAFLTMWALQFQPKSNKNE